MATSSGAKEEERLLRHMNFGSRMINPALSHGPAPEPPVQENNRRSVINNQKKAKRMSVYPPPRPNTSAPSPTPMRNELEQTQPQLQTQPQPQSQTSSQPPQNFTQPQAPQQYQSAENPTQQQQWVNPQPQQQNSSLLASTQQELQQTKIENEKLQRQVHTLQMKLETEHSQLEQLRLNSQKRENELLLKIKQLEQASGQQQSTHGFEVKITELTRENSQLKIEVGNLHSQIQEMQSREKKEITANEHLMDLLTKQKAEIKDLQQQVAGRTNDVQQLSESLKDRMEEKQKTFDEKWQLEVRCAELQKELDHYKRTSDMSITDTPSTSTELLESTLESSGPKPTANAMNIEPSPGGPNETAKGKMKQMFQREKKDADTESGAAKSIRSVFSFRRNVNQNVEANNKSENKQVSDVVETEATEKEGVWTGIKSWVGKKIEASKSAGTKVDKDYPRRALANYDFTAAGEEELTFSRGDILLLAPEPATNEWWQAKLNDVEGMVPISYIQVIDDEKLALPTVEPPSITAFVSSDYPIRAVSLFDYTPTTNRDLALKIGDIIQLTANPVGDQWWQGKIGYDIGFVPVSLFQIIDGYGEEEYEEYEDDQEEGEYFQLRALYDFEAKSDLELNLVAGEIIYFLDGQEGDDWWKGQNAAGEIGAFPVTYVEYA